MLKALGAIAGAVLLFIIIVWGVFQAHILPVNADVTKSPTLPARELVTSSSTTQSGTTGGDNGSGDTGNYAMPDYSGATWSPSSKCTWLAANVPQGNDGVDLQKQVSTQLNIPTDRIRVSRYGCPGGHDVLDGVIILGPREGKWMTDVTVTVPSGGAVDSYVGAKYSEAVNKIEKIGDNTLRVFNGTVTGLSMTIWYFADEHQPAGTGSSSDTPQSSDQSQNQTSPQSQDTAPDSSQAQSTTAQSAPCVTAPQYAKAHNIPPYKTTPPDLAAIDAEIVLMTQAQYNALPADWKTEAKTNHQVWSKDHQMTVTLYPPKGTCRNQ